MTGIIGAMKIETDGLIAALTDRRSETVGGIEMNVGLLDGRETVIACCGVGKVFAAMCAESMIMRYSPSLIINTGVAGTLTHDISVTDVVIADRVCQHDMNTTAVGDPRGLISGIGFVHFPTDMAARRIAVREATRLGIRAHVGCVASGDIFVSDAEMKGKIAAKFGAVACEMEGGAIAQVCYVNSTPCIIIRSISDSADGETYMSYPEFLATAANKSAALVRAIVAKA